jgi:hypothetical protein
MKFAAIMPGVPSIPAQPSKRLHIWCAFGVVLLGIAARVPHMDQSLWYDEMTTLTQYVLQPWSKVLAGRAGEYVPNNHVLHTILAKLVYLWGPGSGNEGISIREDALRYPALCAGVLVPVALAWPLRKTDPLLALLIAIVAALHPWLVDFSVEARGYSLVLLLGIIATNQLSNALAAETARPARWWWVWYAISMALAIYTIPLAILLIPAHAVAVFVVRRSSIGSWIKGTTLVLLIAMALYLPMYAGLLSYYRNPYLTTTGYREFLNALPRFALAGISTPHGPAILWALPVITIVIGSVLGWSRVALRPMLITMGVATLLGVLLPLVIPAATEVRFVPWILPWFCIAVVCAFLSDRPRWGKFVGFLGIFVLVGWQVMQDVTLLPQQQIREGIQLIDKMTPPGRDIMVLYLGARETADLYGNTTHRLLPAPDTRSMIFMEKKAIADTGHLPWVIIYYEKLARDRDVLGPPETRGLWTNLVTLYDADVSLPGRLTPVTIYRPKGSR